MDKYRAGFVLSILLTLAGLALIYYALLRPMTIYLDGQVISILSRSITVQGVLNDAGIKVNPGDSIVPGVRRLVGTNPVISVKSSKAVQIFTAQTALNDPFLTTETIPGNILMEAGIPLFPGDKIRWNGALINPDKPLPASKILILQLQPAVKIHLTRDSQQSSFYTSAATVGQALWRVGIRLNANDLLSPGAENGVSENMHITLQTATPLSIIIGEQIIDSSSAAGTTGEALLDAGIVLQDQDYTIPAEFEPLPDDRIIQVVRVSEEILVQQTVIPYETEYVQDPETGLDQESLLQVGESGIKITSQKVRLENGQEVSRTDEKEWVARPPVNARIGYGSKIIPYILETPDGPIEYYRAVPVYATSYSPCRSGVDACLSGTSLGLPLQKGIIGVTYEWFLLLGGHEVYVPGYGRGVIADVGGGIDGKRWIDLGYSDDDYVHWSQDTTLYFLTPAPPDMPWILP